MKTTSSGITVNSKDISSKYPGSLKTQNWVTEKLGPTTQ